MPRNRNLTHQNAIHLVNPLTGQMDALPDNSEQWSIGMQYSYDVGTSLLKWAAVDELAFAFNRLNTFVARPFWNYTANELGSLFNTTLIGSYLRDGYAKGKTGTLLGQEFVFVKGGICMMYREADQATILTATSSYGPGYQTTTWITLQDELHCYL